MSILVTAEYIIIQLCWKCPGCGHMNVETISTMPQTEHVINDEVQVFYEGTCHECRVVSKIGATDMLDPI